MKKYFDIKSDINPDTYQDEYKLIIIDRNYDKVSHVYVDLTIEELLDLYDTVRHAVDTNIY